MAALQKSRAETKEQKKAAMQKSVQSLVQMFVQIVEQKNGSDAEIGADKR